jgi:hypothetical protein
MICGNLLWGEGSLTRIHTERRLKLLSDTFNSVNGPQRLLEEDLLAWVEEQFPLGTPSLYSGWKDYTLISLDDINPGLCFNGQGPSFAKWFYEHTEALQWHSDDYITGKINSLIRAHPKLQRCVMKRTSPKDNIVNNDEATTEYAWFNVYCRPKWGEQFKSNEQVHHSVVDVLLYTNNHASSQMFRNSFAC